MTDSSPQRIPGRAIVLAIALTLSNLSIASAQPQLSPNFRELLDRSEKERKSLLLYAKGQKITGIVVKVGTDTVEVRNRTYGRIIIRLDSIDALAHN